LHANRGHADRISIVPVRREGVATEIGVQALHAREWWRDPYSADAHPIYRAQSFKTAASLTLGCVISQGQRLRQQTMTLDQGIAFLIFALVAAITPGPSNAMIVATGSAVGVLRGVPCVLGSAIGMGSLLFCSALGLGQIVIAQPMLLKVLNWCGAAFLLWLAWKIATAGRSSGLSGAKPVGFLGAALFQWVNPKGWLVAVGAAGTHLQTASSNSFLQAVTFGTLFFAAAFPSGLVWLALGAIMQRLMKDDRTARLFNVVMALGLATSVIMMFR
jgi:threonine/homoserine/homoserine lactone efflux protein